MLIYQDFLKYDKRVLVITACMRFSYTFNLLGGSHLLHKLNHLNKLELHINKDHHF